MMVLSSGLGTPGGLASHPSHGPLHWGAPPRSPRHPAPSDTPHPSCRKARDAVSPLELKAHRRGTIDSQRGFQEDARPGAPAAGRAGPGPGPEGAAGQHTPRASRVGPARAGLQDRGAGGAVTRTSRLRVQGLSAEPRNGSPSPAPARQPVPNVCATRPLAAAPGPPGLALLPAAAAVRAAAHLGQVFSGAA